MAAVGMMEFLLLFASLGGGQADLLSLIDAEEYFKKHDVEVKVSTMLDRAGKNPTDAPTQVAQLLAIRWLGANPEKGKNEKARAVLQPIAEGKKAQDPQGFAKDFARRALAQIDGKPLPPLAIPENSVREQGLAWFPADANVVGCIDLRGTTPIPMDGKWLRSLMPADVKDMLFTYADALGNVRLDRVSFALSVNGEQPRKSKLYLRFTGQADQKRLTELLQKNLGKTTVIEEKGIKEQPITILHPENEPPAFAFVGGSDFVVAGLQGNEGDHLSVLREMLDVHRGQKKGFVKGPLAAQLKDVSAEANAVVVANLSEPGVERSFSILKPATRLLAQVTRKENLTIQMKLEMESADAAKEKTDQFIKIKRQGEEALKNLPASVKVPKIAVEEAQKALSGAKLYSEDKTVQAQITIPGSLLKLVPELLKELEQKR